MTAKEIINWIRNNPEKAAQDFVRMCESGDYHFSMNDRCSQCPYDLDLKGCDHRRIAKEISES